MSALRRAVVPASRLAVLLLPLPLALLAFGVLVPAGVGPDGLFVLSRLGASYPVLLLGALWLLFAALLAYWIGEVVGSTEQPQVLSRPNAGGGKAVWGFALLLLVLVGAARLVRATLVTPVQVEGASMLPTLESGDFVLVDRLTHGSERRSLPRRGDIVVFDHDTAAGPSALVKRVLGLPGDRMEVRGGRPFINGWQVPSCDAGAYTYALSDGAVHGRVLVEFLNEHSYLTLMTAFPRDLSEAFVVPRDQVFVLGDSRNESTDSRSLARGQPAGVPLSSIVGRARWFLLGTRRGGAIDVSRLGSALDTELHLEGVDVTELKAGIERCLARRPAQTTPPAADGVAATEAR
jgi:signal peptidase I